MKLLNLTIAKVQTILAHRQFPALSIIENSDAQTKFVVGVGEKSDVANATQVDRISIKFAKRETLDTENEEIDGFAKFLIVEDDLDSDDEELDIAYLIPCFNPQDEGIDLFAGDIGEIEPEEKEKISGYREEGRVKSFPIA